MDWKLTRDAIGEPQIDTFHDDPDEDLALGYAYLRALANVREEGEEIRPGTYYFSKMTEEKLLSVGLLVVAMILAVVGVVPARAEAAPACVTIPAVAHRGGDERFTENTDDAFRQAHNVGVPIWETDVRFTSDHVPVIMHDPDVDRTTDGTGNVADHTWAELAAMQTDDGHSIPRLRDLVDGAYVDGARVYVELKVNPSAEEWPAFLAAMNSRPMTSKLVITSFDTATLTAAAANAPAYARGLIQDVGDVDPATVKPYASILIKNHNSITAARMSKWTTGGLTVLAWTVDDEGEWARMAWYPALAGVITDKPAAYGAWQRARTC